MTKDEKLKVGMLIFIVFISSILIGLLTLVFNH